MLVFTSQAHDKALAPTQPLLTGFETSPTVVSYCYRAPLSQPILKGRHTSAANDDAETRSHGWPRSDPLPHPPSRAPGHQKVTTRLQRIYSEGESRPASRPPSMSRSADATPLPIAEDPGQPSTADADDKHARFEEIRHISRQHRRALATHPSLHRPTEAHAKCHSLPADSELEAHSAQLQALLAADDGDADVFDQVFIAPDQPSSSVIKKSASCPPGKLHRAKTSVVC